MSSEKEFIIKADSREEALKIAVEKLKVPRDKINIEFLSKGSSGFIGIGKKPVIIKASYKGLADLEQIIINGLENGTLNEKPPQIKVKQSEKVKSNDGAIEVKNGKVIVTPPQDFGKFPAISPGENVEVLINGKRIENVTVVSDADEVIINTVNTSATVSVDVKISDDKMKAYLIIKKELGKKYSLVDVGPATEIKVSARCIKENQPDNVDFDEVVDMLRERGVNFGINAETILKALKSSEEEIEIEAATGLVPSGVEDATIKYSFLQEDKPGYKNPYGDGIVKSVSVGEVLAIRMPVKEGNPGIDITGKAIPGRVPKDVQIYIREGVELIKNDTVAIATVSGRPVLEGSKHKFLSVLPVHVVDGDVDLKVGNIKFKGDIIVNGSVLDGFKLEAGGNIEVFGNVMRAELFAEKNIIIHKKAITAQIQAGGLTVTYKQIYPLLYNLLTRIASLQESMKILGKQKAFSVEDIKQGEGQLVQLLIDFKFKDIPKTINKLEEILNNTKKEPVTYVIETVHKLANMFCNLGPLRLKEKKEIDLLMIEVHKTVEIVDSLLSNSANVKINYVQNSVVRASGEILIEGMGSITTELEAGSNIIIHDGLVRGGKLTAREKIEIRELGSTNDTIVHIKLIDHCILEVNTAHPIIIIEQGTEKYTVEENCRHLTASVSQEGGLKIEKLKAKE